MKSVTVEETYNTPVEQVWDALTDKEKMKKWYFDLSEFRAEVGFEFGFPGTGNKGDHYLHHCVITEVIPMKKIQYSWQYEKITGYSLVTFELFPEGKQTRLKLTHNGLDSFPQDNSDLAPHNFQKGWNEILQKNLMEHLSQD